MRLEATEMNRRGFLGLLGAALATPVLPAYSNGPDGRIIIRGKQLVLKTPLDLRGHKDFLITDCTISAAISFDSEALVIMDDCSGGLISNCRIEARNSRSPCLKVDNSRTPAALRTIEAEETPNDQ